MMRFGQAASFGSRHIGTRTRKKAMSNDWVFGDAVYELPGEVLVLPAVVYQSEDLSQGGQSFFSLNLDILIIPGEACLLFLTLLLLIGSSFSRGYGCTLA
jgi:hypothetical protein